MSTAKGPRTLARRAVAAFSPLAACLGPSVQKKRPKGPLFASCFLCIVHQGGKR